MQKKTPKNQYSTDTHEGSGNLPTNNALVLDINKAITALIIALVVGGITGALVTRDSTRDNSLKLNAHAEAITKLQSEKVDKDVYEAEKDNINGKLDLLLQHFHLEYNEEK